MLWARILGSIAYFICLVLKLTLRIRIVDSGNALSEKQCVFAFWHGHQFLPSIVLTKASRPVSALVSASRDGQIMATWSRMMGYKPIRGSSSRKAVSGLVLLIRELKAGHSIAVTPDGPVGPKYKAKPGVIFLAKKTGVEIYPIGCALSKCWTISSWDRYEIPKPFARAVFYIGPAIHIPNDADPDQYLLSVNAAIDQADANAKVRLQQKSGL